MLHLHLRWRYLYRDGALGALADILGVLVGIFDVLAGVFLIQSSPFRVPCGKEYAGLKKVRQVCYKAKNARY